MKRLNNLVLAVYLLSVASHAFSFKLAASAENDMLSEDHMFDNHDKKQVKFLRAMTQSASANSIGQIGGIDTDLDGKLVVFHRGSRRWSFDSFKPDNTFRTDKYGPIPEKVLSLINHGKVVESWGSDKFYMPHGLTVDHEGNVWLTDVGLHQVFKYNFDDSEEPQLVLGVEFNNGNDENHLCKPTDVAVAESDRSIFVSDGYCNQRVVQFDKNGNFIKEFTDAESPLDVVHSVTLVEPLGMVCTVSRQEGRIVCFDIASGNKLHEIKHPDMKTVYAIQYDPNNKVLHAATGDNQREEAAGFTFDAKKDTFGELLQKWNAEDRDLKETHDVAISPDGSRVYFGQLNGEIDQFTYE